MSGWWLLLLVLVRGIVVDVCIVGDSTLQMFSPAWLACEHSSQMPCSFETIDSGIYFVQEYKGRIYNRETKLARSTHTNCTVLFADFHVFGWLLAVRKFWSDRGQDVVCHRTITNYHHHAATYFTRPRTAESTRRMMDEAQDSIRQILGSMEPLAWLLPTLPTDNDPKFPQTIRGVTETSILMSASGAETIATLQLLSARLQQNDIKIFTDRLHFSRARMLNDSFTVLAVQSLLASEFQRCAARQR